MKFRLFCNGWSSPAQDLPPPALFLAGFPAATLLVQPAAARRWLIRLTTSWRLAIRPADWASGLAFWPAMKFRLFCNAVSSPAHDSAAWLSRVLNANMPAATTATAPTRTANCRAGLALLTRITRRSLWFLGRVGVHDLRRTQWYGAGRTGVQRDRKESFGSKIFLNRRLAPPGVAVRDFSKRAELAHVSRWRGTTPPGAPRSTGCAPSGSAATTRRRAAPGGPGRTRASRRTARRRGQARPGRRPRRR